jgi:hypothetical protein
MFARKVVGKIKNAPPIRGHATAARGHATAANERAAVSTAWYMLHGTPNAGPRRKRRLWDKPPPRGDMTKLPRFAQKLGILETPFVNPEVCKKQVGISKSVIIFCIVPSLYEVL